MNYSYTVYSAIFADGKRYIGVATNFRKRKNNHFYSASTGSACVFHRAINKYGKDSIHWEVLAMCSDFKTALEVEIESIKNYKTFIRENGYNSTHGGEGTLGTKNTREKAKKPVIDLNTGIIYRSSVEASEDTGIERKEIWANCAGKRGHTKGKKFSFYFETEKYELVPELKKINNRDYEGRTWTAALQALAKPENRRKDFKHSEETKEKLRLANLEGRCGNRGKKLKISPEGLKQRRLNGERLQEYIKLKKEEQNVN